MQYTYRVFQSIEDVPAADWDRIRRAHRDSYSDPRFIAAIERSMRSELRLWCVVFDDHEGRPVAGACVSSYVIDGALLANKHGRRFTWFMRLFWRGFMRYRIVMCGLPASVGQNQLRMIEEADEEAVADALDRALMDIAARERARVVVVKEFAPEEVERLGGLARLGYVRADSPAASMFHNGFNSFEEYLQALRRHYRYEIVRSQKKFRRARFRVEHRSGADEIPELASGKLHRLYTDVLNRSQVKMEEMPAEFFTEWAQQFGADAHFLLIYQGDRLVAFASGLPSPDVYSTLFLGLDYELSRETDLYFNLFYQVMEYAIARGCRTIKFGPHAEMFKARLGCGQEQRSFFVKARGVLGVPLRLFSAMLFPRVKLMAPLHVLREEWQPSVAVAAETKRLAATKVAAGRVASGRAALGH